MSALKGKSIMVLMPADAGIYAEIRRNLEELGFRVNMVHRRISNYNPTSFQLI